MLGASITARLGLDTAGFKAGINEAKSSLASMAGALAGGLAAGGLAATVKTITDYGEKIQNLSERYGVNAVALQRLGNVAEQEGSSLEGVARGMTRLAVSTSRALSGNQEMIKNFAQLGITVEDLRKMSPEDIMVKIGKSSMDAAPMVKLMGRSALELRTTLAGIADGTQKMTAALSEIDIKTLDEAADAMKRLRQELMVLSAEGLLGFKTAWESDAQAILQSMGQMENASKAFYLGLQALSKGKLTEAKNELIQFANAASTINSIMALGPSGARAKASVQMAGKESASRFGGDETPPGTGTLSIKDLAEHGAKPFGSTKMVWEAQQAREALRLEEQAHQYDLTGISASGEISEDRLDSKGGVAQRGLRGRAADIRASIPSLTDKDKFKDALKTTEDHLASIMESSAATAKEMEAE